jgi:hypothetical protein
MLAEQATSLGGGAFNVPADRHDALNRACTGTVGSRSLLSRNESFSLTTEQLKFTLANHAVVAHTANFAEGSLGPGVVVCARHRAGSQSRAHTGSELNVFPEA